MERPLYIAFLWHMHQPFYKDSLTGEISMPWVRLHSVKDYLNMIDILSNFPKIRQTFNIVPSLIDQIEDYALDKLPNEKFLNLSLKPAKDLDNEDKKFILLNFFMANWDNMIYPIPRFHELLLKRGRFISPLLVNRVMNNFKMQDYLDLQVLYNLCWFDPHFRNKDAALVELVKKGSKFTEEDKRIVIAKQIEIIKRVIPTYKELQDRGQIEISVSPYYHPILPLLCDTNSAKTGLPNGPMPKKRFTHPEDAKWQIKNAVRRYEEVFRKRPNGMWPSEGSVSEQILPLLIENEIKWIATDEGILLRSLNKPRTADVLYKPYLLKRDKGAINIIFRDHNLSDAIGFIYQNVPAKQAVSDFISHLHKIRKATQRFKAGNFLVSIILDGENAWEYYPNNGREFLELLYARLSEEEPFLKTTTVSDFLIDNPPCDEIPWLYPGSWINSDFSIWIGQEEKNTSWDYLSMVRDDLEEFQQSHPDLANSQNSKNAWRQIYIAEGSDWNWWYGPQNFSANSEEFDRIYRKHLTNVYKLIGRPPHESLKLPIISKAARPVRTARGLIRPVIDGLDTTYYEWLEAASFDVGTKGGTMHRAESIMQHICCGFDHNFLFVKVILRISKVLETNKQNVKLVISKISFPEMRLEIPIFDTRQGLKAYLYQRKAGGEWQFIKEIEEVAYKKILELAVAFKDLEVRQGEVFKLAFFIEENGLILESQPGTGPIILTSPTDDYDAYHWIV